MKVCTRCCSSDVQSLYWVNPNTKEIGDRCFSDIDGKCNWCKNCDNNTTLREEEEGCVCQDCGRHYKVDINISNELWGLIGPRDKPKGAGLLCGVCIMKRVEELDRFDAYKLTKIS